MHPRIMHGTGQVHSADQAEVKTVQSPLNATSNPTIDKFDEDAGEKSENLNHLEDPIKTNAFFSEAEILKQEREEKMFTSIRLNKGNNKDRMPWNENGTLFGQYKFQSNENNNNKNNPNNNNNPHHRS